MLGVVRFYDPTTGSFLTRDPLTPLTRRAYGYVYGNPLNLTDSSGLAPCRNGYINGGGCDASGNPTPPPPSRYPILDLLQNCNLTDADLQAVKARVETRRADALDAYIGPNGTPLPVPIALDGGDPPFGEVVTTAASIADAIPTVLGSAAAGGLVMAFVCAPLTVADALCVAGGLIGGGIAGVGYSIWGPPGGLPFELATSP